MVEPFTYLGTITMNHISIRTEHRNRPNSWNASYISVQNLFSPRLLSKNMKIKIQRTIILPVAFIRVKLILSVWGRSTVWGCPKESFLHRLALEGGTENPLRNFGHKLPTAGNNNPKQRRIKFPGTLRLIYKTEQFNSFFFFRSCNS